MEKRYHVFQKWNEMEFECSQWEFNHLGYYSSMNYYMIAADTAEHAATLWQAAIRSKNFREAINKAKAFTNTAKAAAALAEKIGGYAPLKNCDPKTEYKSLLKKMRL